MALFERFVQTPQARIAVLETAGTGLPVLLIHGNSSCKEVFLKQLESPQADRYHFIAIDLPGHGQSSNAADPATYSIPGYADVALEVLRACGISEAAVLGWSLGGHIGIEMLGRSAGVAALMIVGAPPFGRGPLGVLRAFHAHIGLLLATKGRLGPRDTRRFAQISLAGEPDPFFLNMIDRTDPRARSHLFRSMMRGEGEDQRWVVEHETPPVAVVNGSHEPFARLDYVASLAYRNLWEGRCHTIEGAAHAPFRESPDAFAAIFERFLNDAEAEHLRAEGAGRMLRSA